jgi:hypothetical protein
LSYAPRVGNKIHDKKNEILEVLEKPEKCLPALTTRPGDTAKACEIVAKNEGDALVMTSFERVVPEEYFPDPLKALSSEHAAKLQIGRGVLPEKEENPVVEVPAFVLEERGLPGDRIEVTLSNWAKEDPVVYTNVFPSAESNSIAWDILSKLPESKRAAEKSLEDLKSELGEVKRPLYEATGKVLTPEQAEILRKVFDKVYYILVLSFPEDRVAEAEDYGNEFGALVLDSDFAKQDNIPKILVNGQTRLVGVISWRDSKEDPGNASKVVDDNGNILQSFPGIKQGLDAIVINPKYNVCLDENEEKCPDAQAISLNFEPIGLGTVDFLLSGRVDRPVNELFAEQK